MQELRYIDETVVDESQSEIDQVRLRLGGAASVELGAISTESVANHTEYSIEDAQDWLDSIQHRPRKYLDPLVFWIFAVPFWSFYHYWHFSEHVFGSIFLQILLTALTPAAICDRVSLLRREAREDALAESADSNWIGQLIHALDASDARQRAAARRVLPRLLAKIRPSDTGVIDGLQQAILTHKLRLNKPRDMDLNLAIIKALERVGDEAALSAIEYVAENQAWLPSQRYVREAARVSLVRLEASLAERRDAIAASGNALAINKPTVKPAASGKQRQSLPEVDALKQRLKEEQEGRSAPGMRRAFLFAAQTIVLPGSLWLTLQSFSQRELLPAAAFGTLFGLATQLPRYVLSAKQANAARRLAAFDNVLGIGPLAEALEWPDPAIQMTATKSLIRLLPLLNASDAGLLTSSQRGCLHRVLRMGNARAHEALMLAILKALEQVGDEAAVPYVKQLAKSNARTRIQQRVQEKARECLPFLEVGANQRQGSQTLLRASSIDSTQPDILLRSASGTSVTEPIQLLRAGRESE